MPFLFGVHEFYKISVYCYCKGDSTHHISRKYLLWNVLFWTINKVYGVEIDDVGVETMAEGHCFIGRWKLYSPFRRNGQNLIPFVFIRAFPVYRSFQFMSSLEFEFTVTALRLKLIFQFLSWRLRCEVQIQTLISRPTFMISALRIHFYD
jgi:hypothetical protein